jgi:hypothetical protein
LRAFQQLGLSGALALFVLGRRGPAIRIERPLDAVLGPAVTEDGTGMVEHDGVRLVVGGPQHPADHLAE